MIRQVFFCSPFIPSEWIAAHGLEPVRLVPAGPDQAGLLGLGQGISPYVRMFVNQVASRPDSRAVLFAATSDQMRRAAEVCQRRAGMPTFLMHVPAACESANALRFYRSELERLGSFLVSLGGQKPDAHRLCREIAREEERPPGGPGIVPIGPGDDRSRPLPIGILGGGLTHLDCSLLSWLRTLGVQIVFDGTQLGERCRRAPIQRRDLDLNDPLLLLAEAYLGGIPDPCQRPNGRFYRWLSDILEDRGPRGIIYLRYTWDDMWNGEKERCRRWLPVPMLDVELDGSNPLERNRTRVEAFVESLS